MWGNDLRNENVLSRWRKTVKDGDDWMSSGREFQRTDAASGNERRPTVDRRNDGTRSEWVDDDRSRRRPGRSAIRVSWLRYGGARPCSTRYAMTATLKSTRSGRRNQTSRCFSSSKSVTSVFWPFLAVFPTFWSLFSDTVYKLDSPTFHNDAITPRAISVSLGSKFVLKKLTEVPVIQTDSYCH